jgi:adenine phosphoribosyltransferase
MDLKKLIRDIPDFPQPGIVFKDITPLLKDSAGLAAAVDAMTAPWVGERIDTVLAVEARGYLLGTPVALRLGAGFVPVRKPGKLPYETVSVDYELEYGTDTIEMHRDAVRPGQRVLIVDDILATGGTLAAAICMVEGAGTDVVGLSVLAELGFLDGRDRLKGYRLETVMTL